MLCSLLTSRTAVAFACTKYEFNETNDDDDDDDEKRQAIEENQPVPWYLRVHLVHLFDALRRVRPRDLTNGGSPRGRANDIYQAVV